MLCLIRKMNRFLTILTLIVLTSCGQSTKSDNAKQTDKLTETPPEIETTKIYQKIKQEGITENFDCYEFDYNSSQQQADSLLAFMDKATDSSLTNRIEWEHKFFCAFPNSFEGMQAVFGYDSKTGASPLYSIGNESYRYTDNHIMSDVIGFFNELNSIPDSTYFDKYVRINIDGYWEADNINEAFGFYHRLTSNTETSCRTLAIFTDEEIKSVFRFIFDGPHPKNEYNEKFYGNLKPKIESQNERLSQLLTESYEELMAKDDGHGH